MLFPIINRNSTLETRNSKLHHPRASVIVLVVAVLALLAVIGTVYIVSARSERSSAAASATAENLDLAQKAVNEVAVQNIGEAVFDGVGILGGDNTGGGVMFGNRMARRHDMPEFNILNPGYADFNPQARDQSWLVANLYRPGFSGIYYNDLTMPQTRMSFGGVFLPAVFDPSTGTYDIAPIKADSSLTGNVGFFRVVADPLPQITLANGNPGTALDDAFVQMLPFSEANGTRYRFGIRILDSSSMANLNVGNALAFDGVSYIALAPYLQNGTYYNGYLLANPNATFASTDSAANLNLVGTAGDPANPGRFGMYNPTFTAPVPPLDYIWSQALFRLESPIRLSTAQATLSYWDGILSSPFDLSDELSMRSYGVLGTTAAGRPASANVWPNTLGNAAPNLRRSFYTAYSYARDLRPSSAYDPATPYTLKPVNLIVPGPNNPDLNGNALIWPPFPARIAINPDVSNYTHWDSSFNAVQIATLKSDELAIAAVNIAQAMQLAGFNNDEQRAFAANYLTCRWNSWQQTIVGGTPAYMLPAGPSVFDKDGPSLRTTAANGDYIGASLATIGTKVFVGYAAQPFINEVVGSFNWDNVNSKLVYVDYAVELYNPYDVALSLEGFELTGCDNTPYDFTGKNLWIPANGYFVLTQNGTYTVDSANSQTKNDNTFSLTTSTKLYLRRKVTLRGGTVINAAVDQYDVSAVAKPATDPSGPVTIFVARPNDPTSRWVATVHNTSYETLATGTHTLGKANPSTNEVMNPIPLVDRVLNLYTTFGYSTDYQNYLFINIADFNRTMRICNEVDSTTGDPAGNGVITAQTYAKTTPDANASPTLCPSDAGVHFDFCTAPYLFYPGLPAPSAAVYHIGDPRAVKLLEYLTLTDRVSDYTIDLGDNNALSRGISKIRIPGRINVNTASAEVLATIPVLGAHQAYIGLILAYRWRTNTQDPRIPMLCRSTLAIGPGDFSNIAEYPGYGIHSLGELQVPLLRALAAAPSTIDARDQIWAAMYNYLTVRSDTFVAYAYLEAVRQNPRYTGAFDNAAGWYTTNFTVPGIGITDDPNNPNFALLRVARRRWVAIVDRSQSNFSRYLPGGTILDSRFTQPRIVASKDLPQ